MTNNDSKVKDLLCPSRSGTMFAPFRSRSANPDGFDSKMRLWIDAIEEWAVNNKKLTLSIKDIQQIFISDSGVRPDKECIRLVFSEMKRRSRLAPLINLKASKLWSSTESTQTFIDNYVDPKSWLGWGVKNLVYNPASWAVSSLSSSESVNYSDLTDMSITDIQRLVCHKSLVTLSQGLQDELIRISKAEKQTCFEWQHLIELITPIVDRIIDATDSKEQLEVLDTLIDYLQSKGNVAISVDRDTKLIKIALNDAKDDDATITKKDIAMARLLRAKELITADADRYHREALKAKQNALAFYNKNEVAKAKSLLRSHKRLTTLADQKEAQLTNVEIMIDQLENTDSNIMILQAYKDATDALKVANTHMEGNTTILDELHDVTAEAQYLNSEMTRMLNDISCISQPQDMTATELEAELQQYMNGDETIDHEKQDVTSDSLIDDLEARLNDLLVCQDPPDMGRQTQDTEKAKTTPFLAS